jgi:serine beta-lactamase-like protein LACTB, mitochondrial
MRSFLSLLFFFSCSSIAWGTSAQFPLEASKILHDQMRKQKIPGLSVALSVDGKVVWQGAYGKSDLENDVRVTPRTVFRIASISKTVTAVAALQLVEREKLELDETIQTHCPAFPQKPWPITVKQLLGHLGGIRHYNEEENTVSSTVHYTDIITPLNIFKNDPLEHEPGTEFLYSTYGYNLVGCAVEGAGSLPFVDFLKENIFDPAGMTRTQADDSSLLIPNRARGYRRNSRGEILNAGLADTSNKIPGGGLSSTTRDLVQYGTAVLEAKLLRRETLKTMFQAQTKKNGEKTDYGLGWRVAERAGLQEIYHSGTQDGAKAYLYMLPDKALVFAMLCNLEDAEIADLTRQIVDLYLEETNERANTALRARVSASHP